MALLGFESTPAWIDSSGQQAPSFTLPQPSPGSGPWDGELLARLRNRSLVREHGQRWRSTHERSRD
jgi:hypothetical protein